MITKECLQCSAPFQLGSQKTKIYCTERCSNTAKAARDRRGPRGPEIRRKQQQLRNRRIWQMADEVMQVVSLLDEDAKPHYADWIIFLSMSGSNMRKVSKETKVDQFLSQYGSEIAWAA